MPNANPLVSDALKDAGIKFTYLRRTYWCAMPRQTSAIRAFSSALREISARFPQATIKVDPATE